MDINCIFYFCVALCYEKHKLYLFELEEFPISEKVSYHVVHVFENGVVVNFHDFFLYNAITENI